MAPSARITQEATSRNVAWGISTDRATEREVVPRAPSPRPWLTWVVPTRSATAQTDADTVQSTPPYHCFDRAESVRRVHVLDDLADRIDEALRVLGVVLVQRDAERFVVERVPHDLDRAAGVDVGRIVCWALIAASHRMPSPRARLSSASVSVSKVVRSPPVTWNSNGGAPAPSFNVPCT